MKIRFLLCWIFIFQLVWIQAQELFDTVFLPDLEGEKGMIRNMQSNDEFLVYEQWGSNHGIYFHEINTDKFVNVFKDIEVSSMNLITVYENGFIYSYHDENQPNKISFLNYTLEYETRIELDSIIFDYPIDGTSCQVKEIDNEKYLYGYLASNQLFYKFFVRLDENNFIKDYHVSTSPVNFFEIEDFRLLNNQYILTFEDKHLKIFDFDLNLIAETNDILNNQNELNRLSEAKFTQVKDNTFNVFGGDIRNLYTANYLFENNEIRLIDFVKFKHNGQQFFFNNISLESDSLIYGTFIEQNGTIDSIVIYKYSNELIEHNFTYIQKDLAVSSLVQNDSGFVLGCFEKIDFHSPQLLFFRNQTTSVNNISDQSILIFPNPSKGEIYFDASINISSLKIYDVHGRSIYSCNCKECDYEKLELKIPNGIYFANILLVNGDQTTEKIIIQK